MGEFKAGILLLSLSIYFVALIITLTLVEDVSATYGLDVDLNSSGGTELLDGLSSEFSNEFVCTQPRSYLGNSGSYEPLPYALRNTAECFGSVGALSEGQCNAISGCTWVNASSSFFGLFTSDASCEGDINLSTYTTQNVTINSFTHLVEEDGEGVDFCSLDDLNMDSCEVFGCTWTTLEKSGGSVGSASMLGVVGSLFTFKAVFSANVWINLILTTLLFYLPLFALLIAIYFMIPVIH